MFRIQSDNWANKRVQIHINDFEEGIQFVLDNNCDGVDLYGQIGVEKITVDLGLLEKVSKRLTYISIGYGGLNISEHKNLHGLYSLKKLKKIILIDQNFPLDFSQFPNLIQIGMDYSKKFTNLEKLPKLKTLVILSKYNETDLKPISQLTSLTILHIYSSKLETLQGIEKLEHLQELSLVRNITLCDITAINNVSSLMKLHIEKCKNLTDFSFLETNASIADLFIDKLDSIDFVSKMPNLRKINFWDSKNGDMTPLIRSKSLKQMNFFPNKKQYSHTIEEVISITGAKRGMHS